MKWPEVSEINQAVLALQQPLGTSQVAGLRPALDVELLEQTPQMDFGGVLAPGRFKFAK
jgi:hypothetical protein